MPLPRGCHDLISPETDTNQHDFAYGVARFDPIPSPLKATYDQNIRQSKWLSQQRRVFKRAERSCLDIPNVWRFSQLPLYRGRMRHRLELHQLRLVLENN